MESQVPTPEGLRDLLLNTLSQSFTGPAPLFVSMCERWVAGEWKEMRMDLQSRLSRMSYLFPTLVFESYSKVEGEARLEWRKNKLLKGFTHLWIHAFKTYHFNNLN